MDALQQLQRLLAGNGESEVVEFKEAKNNYDFDKLGRYFSALSNEANLKGLPSAWLVFGVKDNQQVVGTRYREQPKQLQSLKKEVADKVSQRLTFIEIHTVLHPAGRVLLLEIPAAPQGLPVAWEGHYYGRDGESLGPLSLEEIERIRSQNRQRDWSAGICHDATLDLVGVHRHMHQAAAKLQQRLAAVAILAVLLLPVITGGLAGPGVLQLQGGEGQPVDEEHHVDLFQGIAQGVAHLAGTTEDVRREAVPYLLRAAGQRRGVHQVQVHIVDGQAALEQMQHAVLLRQPVEAFEDAQIPVVITLLEALQLIALAVLEELPQPAGIHRVAGIEVLGATQSVAMVWAERLLGGIVADRCLLFQAGAGQVFLDACFQCLFVGLAHHAGFLVPDSPAAA